MMTYVIKLDKCLLPFLPVCVFPVHLHDVIKLDKLFYIFFQSVYPLSIHIMTQIIKLQNWLTHFLLVRVFPVHLHDYTCNEMLSRQTEISFVRFYPTFVGIANDPKFSNVLQVMIL